MMEAGSAVPYIGQPANNQTASELEASEIIQLQYGRPSCGKNFTI
jgi:hypothetical protein